MLSEFQHILRISGTDIDGNAKVPFALTQIRGININFAHAIIKKAKINVDKRAGFLTDSEVNKIEELISNPEKCGFSDWILNRRKDIESGQDLHLIRAELSLRTKNDVDQMKEIRSWRGYRHAYGLKVRGQRTKTTGRKGKAVGVKKRRGPG